MPRYTQNEAEALVFTFKDGLLSKVAHDLKIRINRFSVDFDPHPPGSARSSIRARWRS